MGKLKDKDDEGNSDDERAQEGNERGELRERGLEKQKRGRILYT